MVVNRDGKRFFRVFLTDDVIIEHLYNINGLGKLGAFNGLGSVVIVIDDLTAKLYAVAADKDAGARDYALDHILRLSAEGAFDCCIVAVFCH